MSPMTDLSLPAAAARPEPPERLIDELHARWGRRDDLWVFGYASLIWRPEFRAVEQRTALVRGWHRALRMRSHINRGTPERPGLVFALLPGGACQGEVYRLSPEAARAELARLWAREMVTGVYTPRWLPCRTAEGVVPALAFTLSRRSEAYLGRLPDPQLLDILRHARGRYGTTLDYLVQTALALRERRIHDREIERLVALAVRAGLLQSPSVALRASARSAAVSTSNSTPGSSTSTPNAG
jgi:cation transport protein ChaC